MLFVSFKNHYKFSPSAMPLQPDTEIIKTKKQ
jgi:hypothetical protein